MSGQIVDVGVRIQHILRVAHRAHGAFVAQRHQVVLVDRTDQLRRVGNPFQVGRLVFRGIVFVAALTRFVGKLPRHDGGVIGIRLAGQAVGTRDQEAHVVVVQRQRLFVGIELRSMLGESGPGMCRVAVVDVFAGDVIQVRHHAAGPFPEVGQVQHALHVALGQFHQQVIQAGQQFRVVVAVFLGAESRIKRILEWRQFRRGQDAQVGHAQRFQVIQFLVQALAVTKRGIGTQIGRVPHVGADEAVGFALELEVRAFDRHELRHLCHARRSPRGGLWRGAWLFGATGHAQCCHDSNTQGGQQGTTSGRTEGHSGFLVLMGVVCGGFASYP